MTRYTGIDKACKDHLNDKGPKGVTGHTGSDGSDPSKRMSRYGTWGVMSGENLMFGSPNG